MLTLSCAAARLTFFSLSTPIFPVCTSALHGHSLPLCLFSAAQRSVYHLLTFVRRNILLRGGKFTRFPPGSLKDSHTSRIILANLFSELDQHQNLISSHPTLPERVLSVLHHPYPEDVYTRDILPSITPRRELYSITKPALGTDLGLTSQHGSLIDMPSYLPSSLTL